MKQLQITRLKNKQRRLQANLQAIISARAGITADKLRYVARLVDLQNERDTLEALSFIQNEFSVQFNELQTQVFAHLMEHAEIAKKLKGK